MGTIVERDLQRQPTGHVFQKLGCHSKGGLQQWGYTNENIRLQMESTLALQVKRLQEKEESKITDTSGSLSAQAQGPILRETVLTHKPTDTYTHHPSHIFVSS